MFRTLLVAYDGSAGAKRALETAAELARRDDAVLFALAISGHLPRYGGTVGEVEEERLYGEQECARLLEEASDFAARRGVLVETQTRIGHPAQEIVRAAEQHQIDLIVLGHSGGHSGVWGGFLGTTAEKVSRHAPCSVLIVR
jgi:nucleotide-binding universal stress UspA family protein